MSVVVALDQGTTSCRAIAFDRGGRAIAVAQEEFGQHYPRPGWVEHDPEEIWRVQSGVAARMLTQAGLQPQDVAAVGIANQRETVVVWDRADGRPVYNAIVWQDRRTAAACQRLRADGRATMIRERTGLEIDAYFSATKIAWILDHVPQARERAAQGQLACGTVDTWLAYRLSGGRLHITDPSNASRTLLYDIHNHRWDEELLALLDVPAAMLPQVRPTSEVYGPITALPQLQDVPLAALAGDQQAATMGQICTEPGRAKNTYGTGCFMLLNTGSCPRPSAHRLLTTIAWQRDGRVDYALEGSVFIGGAIVQWLRDGLGIIETSDQVEALAARVPDTGGVFLVPALAGLGAPHWDPYARGTLVGLTGGTTAAHIARAALEGIAYQVADLATAMAADTGGPLTELRADGGAAANDLLLQFQADILQRPVTRPTVLETTALGAAYLAGLAVGYWRSLPEIAANWRVDRRFEPRIAADEAHQRRRQWAQAVDRARGWAAPDP